MMAQHTRQYILAMAIALLLPNTEKKNSQNLIGWGGEQHSQSEPKNQPESSILNSIRVEL